VHFDFLFLFYCLLYMLRLRRQTRSPPRVKATTVVAIPYIIYAGFSLCKHANCWGSSLRSPPSQYAAQRRENLKLPRHQKLLLREVTRAPHEKKSLFVLLVTASIGHRRKMVGGGKDGRYPASQNHHRGDAEQQGPVDCSQTACPTMEAKLWRTGSQKTSS
jgi:hypothetical protein